MSVQTSLILTNNVQLNGFFDDQEQLKIAFLAYAGDGVKCCYMPKRQAEIYAILEADHDLVSYFLRCRLRLSEEKFLFLRVEELFGN